ncbi:SDR family oxidoreductase [Herbaspirillum hiltneri]
MIMLFDVAKRKYVVTGATSGIGEVTARLLRSCGAAVVAVGRQKDKLALLKEEIGCETLVLDIADDRAMEVALQDVRGIDGLVNCSGISVLENSLALTSENFDRVMQVNARGTAMMSRHVAATMIREGRSGSIVNVSSQAALVALDDHLAYCASKAAMDAITRVMCAELGPHRIRVNSVNPTVTLTPMALQAWADPEKNRRVLEAIPLRKFAAPEDVAAPILFLLSDAAAMISGVSLPIDGGYTSQ